MRIKGIRGMRDEEILECCQSVYDFITDDMTIEEIQKIGNFTLIPKYAIMLSTIEKYDVGDMVSFTKMLNNQYLNSGQLLWLDGARDFFGTERGRSFYRLIIRDLKIKILNN